MRLCSQVRTEDLSSKDQREGWITAGSGRGGSRAEIAHTQPVLWLSRSPDNSAVFGAGLVLGRRPSGFLCQAVQVGLMGEMWRAGRLVCVGVLTVSHFCKRHHFIFICCREEFQLFISICLRIFAVSFPISFLILNNLPTSDKQQTISGTTRVNLVCGVNDISTAAFTFPSDKE